MVERDKYSPFICPKCMSEHVMPPEGWDYMRHNTKLVGNKSLTLQLECQDCGQGFVERYLKCYVTGANNEYIA